MPFDAALSVNDFTTSEAAQGLGESLRHARLAARLTQQQVADQAAINLATVRVLERGGGTMAPLLGALEVLGARLHGQPPEATLPAWIAACRKARGWSQEALAVHLAVSKPTIIQIEHGRGQVRSLLAVMSALGLRAGVVTGDSLPSTGLHHGDCLEVMPTFADRSVDAIISDLPYALTALDWDEGLPLDALWRQFRRLLKPNGVVVLTASQPFTTVLAASNLPWLKYSLVWEKSRSTGFLHAHHRPLKKHEDILVFSAAKTHNRGLTRQPMTYNPQGLEVSDRIRLPSNGGKRFNGRRITGEIKAGPTFTNYPTSILRFASVAKPSHPTEKPLDLIRYLVRTFTNEGDVVMDCCLGSGTTGVAALTEGRQFIGIEKDAGYFEMAKRRILSTLERLQALSMFVACV